MLRLLRFFLFTYTFTHILLLCGSASANIKKHKTASNEMIRNYLNLSTFRHKVLSQNVSNINTPLYKAKEVEMPSNLKQLKSQSLQNKKSLKLIKTSSKHLDGNNHSEYAYNVHKLKDPHELKPNGNNVSLQQQLTKISQNQTGYETALQGYKNLNQLYSVMLGE